MVDRRKQTRNKNKLRARGEGRGEREGSTSTAIERLIQKGTDHPDNLGTDHNGLGDRPREARDGCDLLPEENHLVKLLHIVLELAFLVFPDAARNSFPQLKRKFLRSLTED